MRTVPALFRAAVDDAADRTWLVADGVELTYGAALARVQRAAAGLRATGVGPGDRVVVTARTVPDHVLAWLALMEVGAVQVAVNPASTVTELAGLLRQVEPAVVLTDAGSEAAATVARAVPEAGAGAGAGAGAVAGAAAGAAVPVADVAGLFDAEPDGRGPAAVAEDDVAVMIPTSGTTGRSKLVMQTHRAYVMAGEGFPWWMELTAEDRLITGLPLFHVNAPAYSVLGSVAVRAGLALVPRFSPSRFLDQARRFGATEFNAIGAMLELLMRQEPRPDDADNPLRLCYAGPSPERDRHLEIEERFGFRIVCGYGMSESPYGLIWRWGERPYGTLGSPRQHPTLGHVNDVRVRDGGLDVVPGEVGELELRNPAVMAGYYGMPEETAAVLVDGWLRTGDLVRADGDGTYTFVGRRKEVIRRRGENLSPAEVEAVLERHPDVAEAAVVGVPSELSEEEVKAFVIPAPGRTVDAVALCDFAGEHLARFKVPRYVEVVDELPHTPTGRLAKHLLPRERTAGEVDVTAGHPAARPAGRTGGGR